MAGLKFRVLLDSETSSEVFRDILISDSSTFEGFYRAIVSAFNFTGEQMASFYVSNDNWDKGREISLMDMSYGDETEADDVPGVMKTAVLKNFVTEGDQKFILVYDFMRMWIFLIELIGTEEQAPEKPEVKLAVGMAPPEDSRDPEDVDMSDDGFEDEDEFGFDDFEDGYEEGDFSTYEDY